MGSIQMWLGRTFIFEANKDGNYPRNTRQTEDLVRGGRGRRKKKRHSERNEEKGVGPGSSERLEEISPWGRGGIQIVQPNFTGFSTR